MSITQEKREEITKKFQRDEKDSGSPELQIAVLSHRIKELTEHMKQHKHDYSTQRGLLQMVSRRRRLLAYLQRTNRDGYLELIKELGLRR